MSYCLQSRGSKTDCTMIEMSDKIIAIELKGTEEAKYCYESKHACVLEIRGEWIITNQRRNNRGMKRNKRM